jgi:integrase
LIDAAGTLAGRRELALLEVPSVRHMASVLAARCREPSWVRTLVPAVDRFRALTGTEDLEALLATARAQAGAAPRGAVTVADQTLESFALALRGRTDAAVAGLATGPKVWFRLGGVPVAWRQLPATLEARELPAEAVPDAAERLVLLAPVGSGLRIAELLRLRVGDLGSLDESGGLLPDPASEPLAVRYRQRLAGEEIERITFLSFAARQVVVEHLEQRRDAGLDTGPDTPLIAGPDGRAVGRATVERARRRANAVIRTSSALNVELCRKTGEFFREWGLPGSRFVPAPEPARGS